MEDFRFEKLDIWKEAISLSNKLFDIAELVEEKRYYKFAEQLRSAGMSISNNIAEGSGSVSKKEFSNFLNFARRSIFECANILVILEKRNLINKEQKTQLSKELAILSRRIMAFRKTIN